MSVTDFYDIHEVLIDSADATSQREQTEQMGSKQKFWFLDPQKSCRYLFKYSRGHTGEHWSEKIASEIAAVLGIPHATVELAKYNGAWGVIVKDLRADREGMSLLHGNELLLEIDPHYPSERKYRVSEHTVTRVAEVLETHKVGLPDTADFPRKQPSNIDDAFGLFTGYLLLDAVIGNTDRHHENWAVVVQRSATNSRVLSLAPSYDHASSLGRELRDNKCANKLRGRGARGVEGYADRTHSAFYRIAGDQKPLTPIEVFLEASQIRRQASLAWLSRCEEVGIDALQMTLHRLPPSCISDPAMEFAKALIHYNYERLLSNKER